MKAIWRDETTYSRSDKERIPSVFTTSYGSLKITITNGHIYYPGEWIMHCFVLHIDTQQLKAQTKEEAQAEALRRVRKTIDRLQNELSYIEEGEEDE